MDASGKKDPFLNAGPPLGVLSEVFGRFLGWGKLIVNSRETCQMLFKPPLCEAGCKELPGRRTSGKKLGSQPSAQRE